MARFQRIDRSFRSASPIANTVWLLLLLLPNPSFADDTLDTAQRLCRGIPLTGFSDIKEWRFGVDYSTNGASIYVKNSSARILQQPLEQFYAQVELLNRMWFSACQEKELCKLRNPAEYNTCDKEREALDNVEDKVGRLLRDNGIGVITSAQKDSAKSDIAAVSLPSVQDNRQARDNQVRKIIEATKPAVLNKNVSPDTYYQKAVQNQLKFQTIAALKNIRAALELDHNNDEYLLFAAQLARELGLIKSATEYANKGLRVSRDRYKSVPSKIIPLLMTLARIHTDIGQYNQASDYLGEAEEIVASRGERQSPDLVRIYNLRGILLSEQGRYEAAVEMYGKALKLNANINGRAPSVSRATMLQNLAYSYYKLSKQLSKLEARGMNDEAWFAINLALEDYGEVLGPNHLDVADTLRLKVMIRDDRGCFFDHGDACSIYVAQDLERALAIYSFSYDKNDPRLVSEFLWAAKYMDRELLGHKALLAYEHALALKLAQAEPTDPSVLNVLDPYIESVEYWSNPLRWPDDPAAHNLATSSLLSDLKTRRSQIEGKIQSNEQRVAASRPSTSNNNELAWKPGQVFADRMRDETVGPEMVVIEAGTFEMGSPQGVGYKGEKPQHVVTIPRPFAIGRYEVTQGQYERFRAETGHEALKDENGNRFSGRIDPLKPVVNVHWQDARDYTLWLSEQTGKHYRLPTEAEWEYAARAGTKTLFWWGDSIEANRANCYGCGSQWDGKQTAPVGSFPPNPWGLYDTAGNVSEWVMDCWHPNYEEAPVDGSAWLESNNGDCEYRVLRGGGFWDPVESASRTKNNCVNRFPRCYVYNGPLWRTSRRAGFRVVRELE